MKQSKPVTPRSIELNENQSTEYDARTQQYKFPKHVDYNIITCY